MTGCAAWFDKMEKTKIRPFLIYKYNKIKDMAKFDFEDILEEYKNIEEELNDDPELMENLTISVIGA